MEILPNALLQDSFGVIPLTLHPHISYRRMGIWSGDRVIR